MLVALVEAAVVERLHAKVGDDVLLEGTGRALKLLGRLLQFVLCFFVS